MPKYPFKIGDVVTPADKHSCYFGRRGVVTRVDNDGTDCWVRYSNEANPFCHFTWPLMLVEDYVVDKILSKYECI